MPRPIRVLHCVSHLALGGAERVAITLSEALRGEIDFGVYAVRGLGDGELGRAQRQELEKLHVPVFTGLRLPMKAGGMVTGALAMYAAVLRFKPDLIHLHTEIPEASCATLLALNPRLRTIPLVRTIHNSVYWQFWRSFGRWTARQIAHAQVASVSKGAMVAFLQLQRDSASPDPTLGARMIYNGVSVAPAAALRQRAAASPVRVVFGGRLEDEKGADLIPEILAHTQLPAHQRAELTVFGSGKHRATLERVARQAPAGWSMRVLPPSSSFRDQLPEFDLVLVPSRFEGLCLVAIEAFLVGRPIIATTAPGLSEVLPPKYPWAARVGDAPHLGAILTEAIASPGRWHEIGAHGREFALHRFSIESMANAYRELYQGALGAPTHVQTEVPSEVPA